jgi:hypothetical protein
MKRVGLLKVAPRVQAKLLETETGTRFMVIEQKGRDMWRGRYRSLNEAIEHGAAGIGVDRILLNRAVTQHDVKVVMVVVEEQRKVFLAPVEDFTNPEVCVSRANYQGRSTHVLAFGRWHQKFLGPQLTTKSKSASA